MTISKTQNAILKDIIDGDANASGENLLLKDMPDWTEFHNQYVKDNPYDHVDSYFNWEVEEFQTWHEIVNKSLLPDKIVGACVIGGFAIAAITAGCDIKLIDLLKTDGQITSGLYFHALPERTRNELMRFTGLEFEELGKLQEINDEVRSDQLSQWNHKTERYEDVAWYGDPVAATVERRRRLKEYVDSITE